MANKDEIQVPDLKLPPELKQLIKEIRRTNEKLEKREQNHEPSADAEHIVKELSQHFQKDLQVFERSYAYLTEKLADTLITTFSENIAEINLSNDYLKIISGLMVDTQEINERMLSVMTEMVDKLSSFGSDISKGTKATGSILSRMASKDVLLEAKRKREEYLEERSSLDSDDERDKRRARAESNFSEKPGFMGSILSGIGKVFGIKHIKSLAGFLGGLHLGPGTWMRAISSAMPAIGITGLLGVGSWLAYNAVFGTFGNMYEAFRKQGNNVPMSIMKATLEAAQDVINSVLKKFGVGPSPEKEKKTEDRRQEEIIKGKLQELKDRLESQGAEEDEIEQAVTRYEQFLRDQKEFDDSWAKLYKEKIEKSRDFWFFINKEQIKLAKESVGPLQEALKDFHTRYDDEMKEINNELSTLRTIYIELGKNQQRTPEEEQRFQRVEEHLARLQARKNEIESNRKKLLDHLEWAVKLQNMNPMLIWDDITDWFSRLKTSFLKGAEEQKVKQVEWEKYWETHNLGNLAIDFVKDLRDMATNLLKDYAHHIFIQPWKSLYKGITLLFKQEEKKTEEEKKKLEEELKKENTEIVKPTGIFEDLLSFPKAVNKYIQGVIEKNLKGMERIIPDQKNQSFGGDYESMWEPTNKALYQRMNFTPTQPENTPQQQTMMLKALDLLSKQAERLQVANVVNTRSSVNNVKNTSTTTINSPTYVATDVAPKGSPWSEFSSYGSFSKTGYNI